MNFLSVLYAKAGITVDGVTTLNNTATALTPATNDNSTNIATTAFVKNQNYYPYPTGTTAQYVRGDGSLATFPELTGYVPYTGATANVDLGSHSLTASDLVINHASGSGVAASITKGGNGEALTVVKSSGSGNAASITGGTTLISELNLTTDLADAYIASAATWNAKQDAITLTTTGTSGAATLVGSTLNIPQYQSVLTNPITGTGTTNYLPKFTGASALGNSIVSDNGTRVTIDGDFRVALADANINLQGTSKSYLLQVVDSDNRLRIYDNTANAERFTITSAGNVGIGTTSPATKFVVSNGGAEGMEFGYSSGLSANYIQSINRSTFAPVDFALFVGELGAGIKFYTETVERLTIKNNGFVGIGTTSPNHLLTLNQTASGGTYFGLYQSYVDGNDWRNWAIGTNDQAFGDFVIKQSNATGGNPNSAGTIRLYIPKSGNVLIGTTTDAGYKLDVNGTARVVGAAIFNSSITTTNGYISANYNAGDVITWGGIAPYANVYGALSWDVDKAIVKGRGGYALGLYVDNNVSKGITIATTGAATFSSSVTAQRYLTNYSYSGGGDNYNIKLNNDLSADNGFIYQLGGSTAIASNSYYNSAGLYTATATTASSIDLESGATVFFNNSGLTNGGTFGRTERMRITSAGNVGIGTTSPSHKVHINSTDDDTYALRVQGNTNNVSGVWTGIGLAGEGSNTKVGILFEDVGVSYSRGKLIFAVNNAADQTNATPANAVMTLMPSGNVLIGTTTDADFKLDVNGTARFSGDITISGQRIKELTSTNKGIYIGNWGGAGYWGLGSTATSHELKLDQVNQSTGAWEGATDVNLYLGSNRLVIHSGNIGSQSVAYATTAGALTSMLISQFTNDAGYITSTSSTFSYTASVTLSPTWQNTGVSSTNLGTGAYLVTCNADDFGVGGGQYNCTYTGLMYFFAGGTNGSNANEIVLHHTGHADNNRYIYLRTLNTVATDGKTYLQISGNGTNSAASNYQLTFKKLL